MRFILGIDEVGRGSLAGPVSVAVVAAPVSLKFRNLKDSKRLTAKQREKWFSFIRSHPKIFHSRASVYPKTIDRINISKAANLAATRAFKKLMASFGLKDKKYKVYLDGGLFLNLDMPAKTVIKGDEKYNAIKLASIVAKVSRDRVMKRWHKKFPHYGFNEHVGYGTKKHIRAIKTRGYCEIHRFSFLKNFV